MALDEKLADRVRAQLAGAAGLAERRMFGGLGFLLNGNMCCGVHGEDLIVRVGAGDNAAALARPGARPFDLSGRPMAGWILVGPAGTESAAALQGWVERGLAFARFLPPKPAGAGRAGSRKAARR